VQTIKKVFRKDYTGEDVNLAGVYHDQAWHYETEFIANPFHNLPLGKLAVVIGNGITRLGFDLKLICDYRITTSFGERSAWLPQITPKRFNTYGCNAIYRDFKPDFVIATGDEIITEISASDYCNNSVVYAKKQEIVSYPGKFHVVPQDPQWNSGAIAAYLAAFDGNKTVYMMGFDGIDGNSSYNVFAGTPGYANLDANLSEALWVRSLAMVMSTYNSTEFVRVAPTSSFRIPESWRYCENFRTIDFRQFVLEADI
jgi:hypothetical protein